MILRIEWDPMDPTNVVRLVGADIAHKVEGEDLLIFLVEDQTLRLHPGEVLEVDLGEDRESSGD